MNKKEELLKKIKDNPDAELMIYHNEFNDDLYVGEEISIDVVTYVCYNSVLFPDKVFLKDTLEACLYDYDNYGMTCEEVKEFVEKEISKSTTKKYIQIH